MYYWGAVIADAVVDDDDADGGNNPKEWRTDVEE